MRMSDTKFKEMINDINKNTISTIDLLEYYGKDIDETRIITLSLALSENTSVKSIEFPGMETVISDLAAKNIAEMIKVNHTIKRIYIHFTSISNEGASYLDKALKNNTSLKVLSAPCNLDKNILQNISISLERNIKLNEKSISPFFCKKPAPNFKDMEQSNSHSLN